MVPPLELAAWLNQNDIQFSREPCFLNEQKYPIVDILPEELLKRRFDNQSVLRRHHRRVRLILVFFHSGAHIGRHGQTLRDHTALKLRVCPCHHLRWQFILVATVLGPWLFLLLLRILLQRMLNQVEDVDDQSVWVMCLSWKVHRVVVSINHLRILKGENLYLIRDYVPVW
jgi:4-amino-4-deoxy-L-arabinose transferase-like glycosyltransferase